MDVDDPDSTIDNVFSFIKGQYPTLLRQDFDTMENMYPSESLTDLKADMYGEMRYANGQLVLLLQSRSNPLH